MIRKSPAWWQMKKRHPMAINDENGDDIAPHMSDSNELDTLMSDEGPATSATVVPDDSHITIRQNRAVTILFNGEITVEVVEPPTVFDAEIKQAIRRSIMSALASTRIGSPSNVSVNVSSPYDQDGAARD
jgi:hypothetical protein